MIEKEKKFIPGHIPLFLIFLFSYFVNINYAVVSKIFVYIFCSNHANLHIKKDLTQTTKFNGKGV